MAKLAQVGYGSEGQGDGKDHKGYTYVVNDNVRTGDTLFPAVKHAGNGNLFVTTGKVIGTTKNLETAKGKEIAQELKDKDIPQNELAEAITGKEAGVKRKQGAGGKFTAQSSTHDINGEYIVGSYEQQARGVNLLQRQAQQQKLGYSGDLSETKTVESAISSGQETYKQYAAKFMGDKK